MASGGGSGVETPPPLPEPEPEPKDKKELPDDWEHAMEEEMVKGIDDMGVLSPSEEDDDGGLSADINEDDGGSSSVEDNDDDSSSTAEEDDESSAASDGDDGWSSADDEESCWSWGDYYGDYDSSSREEDDGDLPNEVTQELARLLSRCLARDPYTEQQKAVRALHIVRCRQFVERDPKSGLDVPTRFIAHNVAFFDFEKESDAGLGPPFHTVPPSERLISLKDSINFVSVKILESDVGYPINVFGTILARDPIDYKCVYLFKRARDSPQLITSPNDMLKIKCDDGGRDLSKGMIEHQGTNTAHNKEMTTRLLTGWLSTVQLMYTCVPDALEATISINILEGPCDFFTGKVTAWTSGNKNSIVLYDSEAPGTLTAIGDGGSVALSLCLVAVPGTEALVLKILVEGGRNNEPVRFNKLITVKQPCDHDLICEEGLCKLRVKVAWTAMVPSRWHELFQNVGRDRVLV